MNDDFKERLRRLAGMNSTPQPAHGGYPTAQSNGNGYVGSSGGLPGVSINSQGVITNTGIGQMTYSLTGNGSGAYVNVSPAVPKLKSQSPDLPTITLDTYDDNFKPVVMTLKPENGITVADLSKLMMLCMAYANASDEFSALAYVKKHNLEKHFTYA